MQFKPVRHVCHLVPTFRLIVEVQSCFEDPFPIMFNFTDIPPHDTSGSDKGLVLCGGLVQEMETGLSCHFFGIDQRGPSSRLATVASQTLFGLIPGCNTNHDNQDNNQGNNDHNNPNEFPYHI